MFEDFYFYDSDNDVDYHPIIEVLDEQCSIYRKRGNFRWGLIFGGQATPTKIQTTKVCTHEELVTAITAGYPHPRKFNLRNIVTTKIFTFMHEIHNHAHAWMGPINESERHYIKQFKTWFSKELSTNIRNI